MLEFWICNGFVVIYDSRGRLRQVEKSTGEKPTGEKPSE